MTLLFRSIGKNEISELGILKLSGSNSPSEPNSLAVFPAARSCSPKSCAFDETCHGTYTTCVLAGMRATRDEKSVTVASLTVSLPSQCPSAKGVPVTVVYDTSSAGTNRWKVRRTQSGVTIPIADYITTDDPFKYTAPSPSSRGLLHVDFPVNVYPNEGWKQWRLVDDIVLRNTLRS